MRQTQKRKKDIKKQHQRGISVSELIRDAMELKVDSESDFQIQVRNESKRYRVPENIYIQNTIRRMHIEEFIKRHIFGPSNRIPYEFIKTEEGLISSDRLFWLFYKDRSQEYVNRKKEILNLKVEAGKSLIKDEAEWLKSHN